MLTPRDTIYEIWDGGYATDPQYVSKVMGIIESRGLTAYDDLSGLTIPSINTSEEIDIDTSADLYEFVRIE